MKSIKILLYRLLWKIVTELGGEDMMAMLWATKIVMGDINPKTGETYVFADVPALLKTKVAYEIVTNYGLPELVPVAYGGTAA
jgi:hypothetical protein